MNYLKVNFHTHTYRCKHSMGNDERMVQNAILGKTDIMGFSDHVPWAFYPEDFDSRVRMELCQFDEYCSNIRRLKEKYSDRIKLYLGVEAEYYPHHMDWLEDFSREKELDYIILGCHFPEPAPGEAPEQIYFGRNCTTQEELEIYRENMISGIQSEFSPYIAHPDLFMRSYPHFDRQCEMLSREICEEAVRHHAVLEYNLSGFWYADDHRLDECFPHPAFWQIAADCGVTAVIGYDAHHYDMLQDTVRYQQAVKTLHRLGIKRIDATDMFGLYFP